MTTRRGFLRLCGDATAGIFFAKTGLTCECTGDAAELFPPTKMKELAEQARLALATLTPGEERALRTRFGIG